MNHSATWKVFEKEQKLISKVTFKRPAVKFLISGQNFVNKCLLPGRSVHIRNHKYLVGIGREVPFPGDCSNLLIISSIASEPTKQSA